MNRWAISLFFGWTLFAVNNYAGENETRVVTTTDSKGACEKAMKTLYDRVRASINTPLTVDLAPAGLQYKDANGASISHQFECRKQ